MDPRQDQSMIQRSIAQARGPPRRWVWFLAGAATSALAIKLYDDNSRLGISWRIAKRFMLGPSPGENENRWWTWRVRRKAQESAEDQNMDAVTPTPETTSEYTVTVTVSDERKARLADKVERVSEEAQKRVSSAIGLLRAKNLKAQKDQPRQEHEQSDHETGTQEGQ